MANNPSGQLSKLGGHKGSSGPDAPHIQSKDMGGVHGNNPHHTAVRNRDKYTSKGDIKAAVPLT